MEHDERNAAQEERLAMQAMPRRWQGSYVDVRLLSEEQRKARGLSSKGTIKEVVGGWWSGVQGAGEKMIQEIIDYAVRKKVVSYDTETTGFDYFLDRIILKQIGDEECQYLIWWQTLNKQEQERILREIWMNPAIKKVGVNIKYDAKMILGNHGLEYRGESLLDVQLTDQILNCGLTGDIGLTMKLTGMGAMAKRYLGLMLPKDEDIRTGWGDMEPGAWYPTWSAYRKEHWLDHIEGAEGTEDREAHLRTEWEALVKAGTDKRHYAGDDVPVPLQILKWQMPWLRKFELIETVKLEMAFLPELAEMEMRGLFLDWNRWEIIAKLAEEGLKAAEAELDKLFDVTVTYRVDMEGTVEIERDKNYNSTDQLKDLIREWMWREKGVEVVCNNKHFRESLLRAGMRPERCEKLLEQMMVPDPENPGKQKKVGYNSASDYLHGATVGDHKVPELWTMYRKRLSEGSFRLTDTDSKTLKLMRILHETENRKIDPNMETKIGLPPELVDPILKLREYSTKLERYAWSWKNIIHPVSGRIHTDTTQCAADTARLTTRPNFQNFPAGEWELEGFETKNPYRECIREDEGYVIVASDFSQIEPRIIGEISNDPMYMRVFWSGSPGTEGFSFWCGDYDGEELDLYATVGATVGVLPADCVTKTAANSSSEGKKGRKYSKIIVLGLGYGTGPEKFQVMLCLDTGVYHTLEFATKLFNDFWSSASLVKKALDQLSSLADPKRSKRKVYHPFVDGKVTYSESLMGRRRFFDPDSPAWWTVGRNHPIQSTGADILKLSVVWIQKAFREEGLDAGVILTAHDEILVRARKDHAPRVVEIMDKYLPKAGQKWCKHVPISADAMTTLFWQKD